MQLSLTDHGQEVTGHAVTIVQQLLDQLLDQLLEPLGGLNGQRTAAFSREPAVPGLEL